MSRPGAGQSPAEHGGVGGEDRAHIRREFFQGQQPGAAHPLVKKSHRAAAQRVDKVFMDRGDHFAAGRGEHHRLNIVPAAGKRVHAVIFPEFVEQLVGGVALGKIHQNGLGPARYVPAAQTAFEILGAQHKAQGIPDVLVGLLEVRILL